MNPLDFCYFLQGFSEIGNKPPTKKQWDAICAKLNKAVIYGKIEGTVVNHPSF